MKNQDNVVMSVVLYELRRNSMIAFRPTFRIRTHLNPILRSARTIRVIKKPSIKVKTKLSLIPKKPLVQTRPRRIKVV